MGQQSPRTRRIYPLAVYWHPGWPRQLLRKQHPPYHAHRDSRSNSVTRKQQKDRLYSTFFLLLFFKRKSITIKQGDDTVSYRNNSNWHSFSNAPRVTSSFHFVGNIQEARHLKTQIKLKARRDEIFQKIFNKIPYSDWPTYTKYFVKVICNIFKDKKLKNVFVTTVTNVFNSIPRCAQHLLLDKPICFVPFPQIAVVINSILKAATHQGESCHSLHLFDS